ncbi:heme-copper oxidase subunit III [Pyxidicoccus sp. 3LG]
MKPTAPASEQRGEAVALEVPAREPRPERGATAEVPTRAQPHADAASGGPLLASPAHAETTAWLGTVLGLAAWTMFFVSLTFAVGWYRLREPWPPLPISPALLALPGLALVIGSVVLHRATRGTPHLRILGAALVLGMTFVGLQATWTHLAWWNHHLRIPEDGVSASAFYGLTALHVLHVLAVVAGLFLSVVRLWRGADVRQALRGHALGWHFVTATWLLLFAAVYLP